MYWIRYVEGVSMCVLRGECKQLLRANFVFVVDMVYAYVVRAELLMESPQSSSGFSPGT